MAGIMKAPMRVRNVEVLANINSPNEYDSQYFYINPGND